MRKPKLIVPPRQRQTICHARKQRRNGFKFFFPVHIVVSQSKKMFSRYLMNKVLGFLGPAKRHIPAPQNNIIIRKGVLGVFKHGFMHAKQTIKGSSSITANIAVKQMMIR